MFNLAPCHEDIYTALDTNPTAGLDAVEEKETCYSCLICHSAMLSLSVALSCILFLWKIQHNTLTVLCHGHLHFLIWGVMGFYSPEGL
jgi:hypothetical protein